MQRIYDEIRIENLEVYAYHGVFPEENEKGQLFLVNAILYTQTQSAGRADELSLSTNYGEVCHLITRWMTVHTYQLIEAVAENVARQVLFTFPLVHKIDLEIRKPQAPIGLPFGCVSVKIQRGWHHAYLAVGSNMGEREGYIQQGIEALKAEPEIELKGISKLLITKPYGGVEQEDFLNGALEIRTLLSPQELLGKLQQIEVAADRKREVRWGPRTLDLDIIFYDELVYSSKDLIIPHIDMENRFFVLKPLSELAPNYRHPLLGKTVQQLLQALENAE